jgi:homoserine O-acetyltransferase
MRLIAAFGILVLSAPAHAQTYPTPVEADFVARDVRFESGETMAAATLHYRTIGTPRKDADGVVRNGVLILHGTGGNGRGFLTEGYAGRLFGKGQLLDAERYFIILPDGFGHGQSSKPSDGLRMKFPKYGYRDMVSLQHRLVTEGLGLTHLHLVMGTSMGAMHTWMWGYMYPDFADGLVPLASNPVEIAGRNRIWRKALVDAIVTDPSWQAGNYTEQPRGMASAIGFLLMATSVPLQWQKQFPTREAADIYLAWLIS